MRSYYPSVGLKRLCGLFGRTRQAFYEQSWQLADQQLEQSFLIDQVKSLRQAMPGVGGVALHKILKQHLQGHRVIIGRDRFFSLLRDNDLLVRRKRKYVRTTDSNHHYRKWPNLITGLTVNRPAQLWVSDITYLSTENGFNYLSLITDAYSRKIVGYHLSQHLKAQGPVIALKKAIKSLSGPASELIHHSDRGIQYCCQEYVSLLQSNGIDISMTQSGSPYENAIAERVNGILKTQMGLNATFKSYQQAVDAVSKAIDAYNRLRPHMSCNYMTPNEAHCKTGLLIKKWKTKNKSITTLQL
jgi:putative transposase